MRDLERSILQGGTELLHAHAKRLAACDMTWRGPTLKVWRTEPERYTSEFRIWILKGGQIDDGLEFHIYLDGQPCVTSEEAVSWLNEQLEQVASQQG